jgi:hypothetical protein
MKIVLVALHLQKNVLPFLREKNLLPQTAFGVQWPCNVGKKVFSVWSCVGNTFLSRGHVRLQGRTERSVGRHTSSFNQIFNRQHEERWCVSDARLLNIIALCNPAAFKNFRPLHPSEELHKTRLCLSMLWASFIGVIFCTSDGKALGRCFGSRVCMCGSGHVPVCVEAKSMTRKLAKGSAERKDV